MTTTTTLEHSHQTSDSDRSHPRTSCLYTTATYCSNLHKCIYNNYYNNYYYNNDYYYYYYNNDYYYDYYCYCYCYCYYYYNYYNNDYYSYTGAFSSDMR